MIEREPEIHRRPSVRSRLLTISGTVTTSEVTEVVLLDINPTTLLYYQAQLNKGVSKLYLFCSAAKSLASRRCARSFADLGE